MFKFNWSQLKSTRITPRWHSHGEGILTSDLEALTWMTVMVSMKRPIEIASIGLRLEPFIPMVR